MWDRPRWIAMSPWAFAFSSDNYTDPPGPPREPLQKTNVIRSVQLIVRLCEGAVCFFALFLLAVSACFGAMAEFRRCGFTANAPGPATRLTVAVKNTRHMRRRAVGKS